MSLTKLTKDLSIISKLSDEPNDTDGLTADELKAKFDESGNSIKDYLNNTLTPELDSAIGESYTKPDTGIPKTDLASDVQTSLGKADTALQAGALPTGGNDGDVLVKNGAADYAARWERPKYFRPNLLDNWYFAKGFKSTGAYGVFPVNQRRRSTYTTTGFAVDRWRLSGANTSLVLDTDAISLGSTSDYASITQMVSDGASLVGKTITFSALVDTTNYVTVALLHGTSYANSSIIASYYSNTSGVISLQHTITSEEINATYPNLYVRIIMDSGKTGKIIAAKLEVGDMQTLARWDGINWVLNEIPVYADELRKCQAYFQRLYSQLNYGYGYGIFAAGYAVSATQIRAPISLATALPLMDTPTIITSGSFQIVPASNLNAPIAVTSISVLCNATTSLFLIAEVSGGLTAGTAYFLRNNNDASAYIEILAET